MLLAFPLAVAAPLSFDLESSALRFTVEASPTAVKGRATRFSGEFDPVAERGSLVVEVAGLTTGLGPRDQRMLHTALELARFPTLAFTLSRVDGVVPDAGEGSVTLVGRLQIRDMDQELRIPVTTSWEGSRLRLRGAVDLKWADFGVPDPSVRVSAVGPGMVVDFDVVAVPEADPG